MFESDEQWLARRTDASIAPQREIIYPHHHLWDEQPHLQRYLLPELQADLGGGHRVVGTVFMECMWAYRTDGPDTLSFVGETEAVARCAEQSQASGPKILGIVARADMMLG